MKRKEYILEELFDFDPKRKHYDPEFYQARVSMEIKHFIDSYYLMLSNFARYVYEDAERYQDGVYFGLTSHTTKTPEARQFLINNYDLYYGSGFHGLATRLVSHLDWPKEWAPVYGYQPPLRRLPPSDETRVEECI